MKLSWEDSWYVHELMEESDIRFHIVKILEGHPDGLIVTEIHKELIETGFSVTQPNISKHLDKLVEDSFVMIVRKRHPGIGRRLRFFVSLAGFLTHVADRVKDKMAISIAETLEDVADSAPRFDDFGDFQNFLTKLAEAAGGEVSVSDELYEALSVRKPYDKIAKELRDYQGMYRILDSIIEEYKVEDRLMEEFNITGKDLGQVSLVRYNLAVDIIDGAIAGDEKAIHVMEELLELSQGEHREELLALGKIVDRYKNCNHDSHT